MKKIYIIPLALFFLSTITSNVFAAAVEVIAANPGDQITIVGGTSPGGDLDFNPSPGTLMGASTEDDGSAFAVNAISSGALAAGEGIEYGMAFDSNQVFKTPRAEDYTFLVPTATDSSGL
ncbi:MAG: hypothetical protein H8D23_15985 [Candidatus Brocadiales bacterium]|nr:hypothetical protein [Candidatus Brocadiales bacterium]